jgi:hypothetical protein
MSMDFQGFNFIVDPTSPMMQGIANPIPGNSSSHCSATGLPGSAHVVVTTGDVPGGTPTLYDLISVPVDLQSFTVE